MVDLPFRSAKQLAQMIRRRKVGCLELLDLYLDRVERFNPRINAIVAMDVEGARKRARAADRALARDTVWGPLHGVPMTVKESFDVAGLPTTWGFPEFKDNRPTTNALAVDRLLAAGVVLFGKTNVPISLADWQSYNAIYGTTGNPWDLDRSPGGSSGGSAAALAAGLTALEAGSDIGASIRNPAHYCGVFGHKPTFGICPPRGQALPGKVAQGDISVIGPMARSADDLDLALAAMAGADELEEGAWQLRLRPSPKKTLREFRIGVMLDDPNSEVDQPYQDLLQRLYDWLAKKRVKVNDQARPDIDTTESHAVYVSLLRAATSGRITDEEAARQQASLDALGPGDDSYYARMLRANTMAHREWLQPFERRQQLRWKWHAFFQDYDLLLCPAAASAAFPHDHEGERYQRTIRINNKSVPTTDQLFWAGYSGVVYLPSTVAPIGLTPDGLPVGVQIIAPYGGDRTAIHFARLIEREYGGFLPPPDYA